MGLAEKFAWPLVLYIIVVLCLQLNGVDIEVLLTLVVHRKKSREMKAMRLWSVLVHL